MAEPLTGLELQSELGRGSMGQVVLARQLPSGRPVAVKRLCETSALSSVQQARLRREARALERLDDDHIVRLLQLFEFGEELLLVLEYVDGPSLGQLLATGGIGPPDALAVLAQVQSALAHAHALGVLHRDVKPGNVLVTRQGVCKLADFGLARFQDIADAAGTRLTNPGAPVGTAAYMSPEAIDRDSRTDERSDVYGLGVLSYQLLVGRLPFPNDLGMVAILDAHLHARAPRPTELVAGFPSGVEAALLAALEKEPDRRPTSVDAFWDRLEEAASSSWPGWRHDADLASLVATCPAPAAVRASFGPAPHAEGLLLGGGRLGGLERIEPTFPDLPGRRRPGLHTLRWVLVALTVVLAIVLLVRAVLH